MAQHRTSCIRSGFVWRVLTVCVAVLPWAPTADGKVPLELALSGVQGGLIVHLGCGEGTRTVDFHVGPQFVVHGLDRSTANVFAARRHAVVLKLGGSVSFDRWDGRHLPYADNLVNLLIVDEPAEATRAELLRVLAPNGILLERKNGTWVKAVKPRPGNIDQWTHYLHGPDGNPVANDQQVGPPRRIQWLGKPLWSRHHDHMASMTSLVSASGRLFYILDEGPRISIQLPSQWRLVARDAFNGTVLWKRDIEHWNTRQYPLKSGPAHLLRRLVAVADRVYVTLGIDAPVTALDAATGATLMTYADSKFTREIVVSDGVLLAVADSQPSPLAKWQRVSTYVWANTRTANPEYGWHGKNRRVLAYDSKSGRLLWRSDMPVAPCSLAADGKNVVLHDGAKLVCLQQDDGTVVWKSEDVPTPMPVQTNTGPRIVIYDDVVLTAPNSGKIYAFAKQDGHKLWEQRQRPSGHMSLKDLMVVNGLVWTAAIANSRDDGTYYGYDVHTGKLERQFEPDVSLHWFHHRCYPAKASGNTILASRNGTEYVDLVNEHWEPNHWVRGGCIYGVMPCNGMTYAPMDSCGCQLEAKLEGFKALTAGPVVTTLEDGTTNPRLEKGAAFGQVSGPPAAPDDWPTYRHDAARSGAGSTAIPDRLGIAWSADLGAQPTPPVIAAGRVFVATKNNHTVHALSALSGAQQWSYTVGGRVDSPPTYYDGLVILGSADGYVYALRATDGVLAWRFRAAPIDRRMMAFQQIESAWPVHGSVLVHDNIVYCTAGRNMFTDGGIHFVRLDPHTGKLLGEVVMDDQDPVSGTEMQRAYLKQTRGNNMPVALSDVLSCDGRNIWMRSQKIDLDGNRIEIGLGDVSEQPAPDCHLFCQIGFLDDSYFFRSYWTYGRRVTGGYGGWMKAGQLVPSGRIMCFDDTHVFGFGRKPEFMVNSSVLEYQLFAADKAVTREAIARVQKAANKINARSSQRNASSSDWLLRHFFPREDLTAAKFYWSVDQPALMARAMALAGETVFVAGPPYEIDEREIYRRPGTPDTIQRLTRQQAAFEGAAGGEVWSVSKRDGRVRNRVRIDSVPVFDGLAAAANRLYCSLLDGRVVCLADSGTPLATVDKRPVSVAWNQPEDSSYLLPPAVPKDDDFDRVIACSVVSSKLGYRVTAKNEQRIGLALKKLDQPVTGTLKLTAQLRGVQETGGRLSNGYLVFGNAPDDRQLIKCGVRLRAGSVVIVQGPMKAGSRTDGKIKVDAKAGVPLMVTVDLKSQRLTVTAGSVVVEAALRTPMERISMIGYAVDNARVDFSPIKVATQ